MTLTSRLILAGGCVALLAGCDYTEPYERPYTWHLTNSQDANLAAMVANPVDLIHGHGTGASDGSAAAAAVDRLRHDKVKPLTEISSTKSSIPTAAAEGN